jgi:hypothetical protein
LENFDLLSDLIIDLGNAFDSDERFSFYFKIVDILGGENDADYSLFLTTKKKTSP